jgi:putative tryptophan/tyrosine transport system substrate-binding protein
MSASRCLVAVLFSLSILTGPLAAGAQQQANVARIGFLGSTSSSGWGSRVEAFRSGLRDLGYVEGKNAVIEFRWADERYDRLPRLATELLRLKVDLLVTYGTPATLAAKRATTTIPIVMVHSGDAVAAGIVASLARPGANITGSTYFLPQLMAKRLELLKDAAPRISQVAILVKPDNPFFPPAIRALEIGADTLNVRLQQFQARAPDEFPATFSAMPKRHVDGVVVLEDAVFVTHARAIAEFAAKHRLPTAGFTEFAEAGGLIGYGVDFPALYRRSAVFVDKILRGTKPADIPVEQANKFDLLINLKTARAIGFTIPPPLLARADQVIE